MRINLILLLQLIVSLAISQKQSFLDIRLGLKGTETKDDSSTLLINVQRLEAIDTLTIRKTDLHNYFAFLGKSYYLLNNYNKSNSYGKRASENYNKVLYHRQHDYRALWYFAVYYAYHDDCAKAKSFRADLMKYGKRKKWNRDCIIMATEMCP